jgi:hypothetical protein
MEYWESLNNYPLLTKDSVPFGWLEDIRPPAGVTSQYSAIVYRNRPLFGLSRKQSLQIECRHKLLFRELSEDNLFASAVVQIVDW